MPRRKGWTTAAVALALGAALPATASAAGLHVKNDRGVPQYSFWKVNEEEYWHPTDGFGAAEIAVVPGDVVRVTRTIGGPAAYPPPEGYGGQAYTVPDPAPSDVAITLPHTGPIYQPQLSDAERWVIGKANEKRAAKGVPPLRVSTSLSAAADSMARQSVIEDRWPPSFLTAYQQDFGWPAGGGAALDNPGSSPRKAIAHWTDGSVREQALVRADYDAIGVGEGGGWFIAQLSACPPGPAASRCGMTDDTGDPTIALPPEDDPKPDPDPEPEPDPEPKPGPKPQPKPEPGDGSKPPPPFTLATVLPGRRSAGTAAVARGGRFSTRRFVNCPAGASCLVTTTVRAKVASTAAKRKRVKVGGSRYTLAGGAKSAIASKLNKKGRRLLRRNGKLTVRLKVAVRRGPTVLRRTFRLSLEPRRPAG
jgi:hypothetical protein